MEAADPFTTFSSSDNSMTEKDENVPNTKSLLGHGNFNATVNIFASFL